MKSPSVKSLCYKLQQFPCGKIRCEKESDECQRTSGSYLQSPLLWMWIPRYSCYFSECSPTSSPLSELISWRHVTDDPGCGFHSVLSWIEFNKNGSMTNAKNFFKQSVPSSSPDIYSLLEIILNCLAHPVIPVDLCMDLTKTQMMCWLLSCKGDGLPINICRVEPR